MSSGHWYQYATTSNRIKQTYVNGFLDVSGDLVVRNNNFNINGLISQNTDSAATNAQYTYISWNDVSGTFATVGNPTFSNNITVNQNTKTATLSVTGDSSLNKLFLNGNLAIGKTAVTSGTTLDISGVALISSNLAINNATYASMTNSSNNTRVLITGDSSGSNADVSGQIVLTGSTDTNSRMGFMLDTTTTNFPIGKIQVNQTNVGGGQRLALNPAGGKVGISAVPDASGTQLEVAGGIASKEPTTGNTGVGTFVKTMTAGNWYKLAQCGDPQSKVTFRVVGLVTYQNNSYNIDVTTTNNSGGTAPISSILLNNTIGSNVFTDANIDFVVVYDSTNQTSSYYIKCNSNAVYCAVSIYVTAKIANGTYSKLRFYQDRVFALSYAGTISTSVDTELSASLTQFVISTHANTTYPMVVSSAGNVAIGKTTAAVALDVNGRVIISTNDSIIGTTYTTSAVTITNKNTTGNTIKPELKLIGMDGDTSCCILRFAEGSFTGSTMNENNFGTYIKYDSVDDRMNFGYRNGGADTHNFRINKDGTAYSRGAIGGSQAINYDYAEMFEWEDRNPNGDKRYGHSVVFTNNRKIKIATATDDPKNIIGIVSVAPFILAGTAVFDWGDMYLTDVWGSLLLDSCNNKIINPKYNPNLTYLPREERKEWTKIGLIGILKLLKGQSVHPNWIKIRDINNEIEEWFIR